MASSALVTTVRFLRVLVSFPRFGDVRSITSSDVETLTDDLFTVLKLECEIAGRVTMSLTKDSSKESDTMCPRSRADVMRVGTRDVATFCEIDRWCNIIETSFARFGRVLNVTGVSSMSKLDMISELAGESTAAADKELIFSVVMSFFLSPQ